MDVEMEGVPEEVKETEEKNPEIVSNKQPSPRGVLENSELESDSDSSSTTTTISDGGENDSPDTQKPVFQKLADSYSSFQWRRIFESIKRKSANSFSVIPLLTKSTKRYEEEEEEEEELLERTREKPSWRSFSYSELVDATDNFNPENLLGIGGHAEVYKGHLPDGRIVAVKKIVSIDKEEDDQAHGFLTELGIIAHINHPNAAHLIGFGIDGGLHLVLEFSPYGNLTAMLFGSVCLDWKTRFKVAVGIAEGLKYLHHDCRKRIIHRDITASNILLTEDYEAQISDFGLAKWLPEQWHNHVVHHIEGTFGYLAPEYFMHGIVDEKTDVFAFGVLLLEIVTGRRAVDSSQKSLAIWAKPYLESNQAKELIDPRVEDNFDPAEMQRAMVAASICISHLANMRPTMTKVVQLLKNEDEDGPVELHQISCGRKAVIVDGCDLKDYNCNNYINDLNRHMQLVLE
ncbi:receptor-like cytosolic serine/threonine-protein kinase RBK1 [Hibiscus syriacus]|uniref:receptor-like cytosolic serine/threonine-protein kinase RBK1 n=1 Tax=Hibiscus syriacus TaxID=106335 RepID=UPI0019225CE1|nr:receptor-like cytosolic serine/threonine-protein kinase RBK1 [Hibiscus syriacus]